MDKKMLTKRIAVASGRQPADTVIKNGKIVDVFNGEVMYGDIAIVDGYFAGIGDYTGITTIDANGSYVCPSFIDGHVHIESSMLTPKEFAKVLLLHGVTTVIADPHEIANVSGVDGIQYILDSTEQLPFDFFIMLPSCVPATSFEHAGAILQMEDLKPFYQHPRVLGLAEVMNFPAVLNAENSMMEKLIETRNNEKKIDGHAAGLTPKDLNVYMASGIRTDHECTTLEEAKERLRIGMYLMIREGTVAKDLGQLIGVITNRNSRRCLFVTDDKHLDDLLDEGSIDHNVRLAIGAGIHPITAIQMATINAAECFGLEERGAIAPGYKADFLIMDDLESVKITQVFKSGTAVVKDGKLINFPEIRNNNAPDLLKCTVNFQELTKDQFQIPLKTKKANIIGIIPNSLITNHLIEEVDLDDAGLFQPSIKNDQLRLAVIERHHLTKNIGLGIVKGLGLKTGAIATTIAHDSHNLIIAGTNDQDMLLAAQVIKEMQGGLVVIKEGQVLSKLKLPIAGLMSEGSYQEVNSGLFSTNQALKEIGAHHHFNPFLTLSFLALPVIPELKLTDGGLFQVSKFQHISIEALK
ncbi:adenine deaminase [Neobacillus sp. NRS-1170]|uniref:adenine deaminase n=1 Tax=Neobacillus sp. NRS-1170 TaxID=3233898 RepID=UPI003D2E02B9